jgi:hypothetical protein
MVAPCYFLACRMFDDAGLKTGAIPEGGEGIDLEYLKGKLVAAEAEDGERIVSKPAVLLYYFWFDAISSIILFVT